MIEQAASQKSVLEAALMYADAGVSVIPVKGKICPISWASYQYSPAPFSTIHQWHKRGFLQGVGLVCGTVSLGLAVIDLDGLEAVAQFQSRFPHLCDTYTVKSGSGLGLHLYYATRLPAITTRTKTDIGGFELRSDGCYVVAPPSIHDKSGLPYIVERGGPIMRLTNLDEVRVWIMDKIRAKQLPKATKRLASGGELPGRYVQAYVRGAMRNELDHVRGAYVGARNDSLFHAARRLGSLLACPDVVRLNILNRYDVERALEAAAASLVQADGLTSVLKTIQSGLERGINEPYSIPEPRNYGKETA